MEGSKRFPTSQISLTCCRFSTFLGIVKESSHSFNIPDPYSLNTAIVAESVRDTGVAFPVGAAWFIVDGMRARGARLDGLMPGEVTAAVEVAKIGWLNAEGRKLVGGCWVVDDWMEGVKCDVEAAWFIVDGMRARGARVDGLMRGEVTAAVEMGKAGWLNEEGMNLLGGCWVVDDCMEGVRCDVEAAWFIVDGMRARGARVDGLMPGDVTAAVEMGKVGWLDAEGMKIVGGCWLVDDWMEEER